MTNNIEEKINKLYKKSSIPKKNKAFWNEFNQDVMSKIETSQRPKPNPIFTLLNNSSFSFQVRKVALATAVFVVFISGFSYKNIYEHNDLIRNYGLISNLDLVLDSDFYNNIDNMLGDE